MAKKDEVVLFGVGDLHPMRDNPESLLKLALPTLKQADIRFGQLEENFSTRFDSQVDSYPMLHGSTDNARLLAQGGFDVLSLASNHILGLGEVALLDTLKLMKQMGIAVIGAGKNIKEARKPVILERKGTRVAFLGYCSVLPRGADAKAEKAGAAPLRADTYYEQVDWQAGTPPRIVSVMEEGDLAAMQADIKKVRPLADVVVVSMHWGIHHVPGMIAMYQKEAGHAAIDAGADLILGHHAHILKAIEVYKGKVIFYSLGNFAFDMPVAARHMSASVDRYGWDVDPEYPTYMFPADARKSMIAKCVIANKKVARVSFLPGMINKKGQIEMLPRTDKRSAEVLEYMRWCGKDQKIVTTFTRDGDEVIIS